jgi:hypothetical protein
MEVLGCVGVYDLMIACNNLGLVLGYDYVWFMYSVPGGSDLRFEGFV